MRTSLATAIVTGGNRGIGLEVCRALAARGHGVIMACRDAEQGREAAGGLISEGPVSESVAAGKITVLPLEVTDTASVAAFAERVAKLAERPSILVNNAALSLPGFDAQVVRRTLEVNLHGVLRVTDALTPLLQAPGNIVMVSSGMGSLDCLGPALRAEFAADTLSREGLLELLRRFERDVAAGRHTAQGWPSSAYSVSKVALNAFTRIWVAAQAGSGLQMNAVCPGWVRTRMGGDSASRSPQEGAAGIVWAATLPAGSHSGGFFRDRKPQSW